MSSFPLTNSYFSRWKSCTTNQINIPKIISAWRMQDVYQLHSNERAFCAVLHSGGHRMGRGFIKHIFMGISSVYSRDIRSIYIYIINKYIYICIMCIYIYLYIYISTMGNIRKHVDIQGLSSHPKRPRRLLTPLGIWEYRSIV